MLTAAASVETGDSAVESLLDKRKLVVAAKESDEKEMFADENVEEVHMTVEEEHMTVEEEQQSYVKVHMLVLAAAAAAAAAMKLE